MARSGLVVAASLVVLAVLGVGIYKLAYDDGLLADEGKAAPLRAKAPLPVGTTAALSKRPPRLGLHVELSLLARIDLVGQSRAAKQPTAARLEGNLRALRRQGYRLLIVDILTSGGKVPFASPLLKARGYRSGPKLLSAALRRGAASGMEVLIDLSVLAQRLDAAQAQRRGLVGRPLSSEALGLLAARLLRRPGVSGLVGRGFPVSYRRALRRVSERRHKRLVVCPGLPRGVGPGSLPASRPVPRRSGGGLREAWIAEDALVHLGAKRDLLAARAAGVHDATLATSALRLSAGATLARPLWSEVGARPGLPPGAARNLLLLRAVQFGGEAFVWRLWGDKELPWVRRDLRPAHLIEELDQLRRRAGESAGPTLNLVLALPPGATASSAAGRFTRQVVGPLLDAALLAGYSVRTSRDRAIPGASLTVVLTMGKTPESDQLLPPVLAELIAQDVPLWVVVAGLSDDASWRGAYPALGLAAEAKPILGRGPLTHVEARTSTKGRRSRMPWAGATLAGDPWQTAVPIGAVSGEVVATAKVQGMDSALIVRHGRRLLINASSLNRAASFLLHRLLPRRSLERPFAGHGVVDPRRSAFWAWSATPLRVRLPLSAGRQLRLTRFGRDGRRQTVEMVRYRPPLAAVLEPWQLLVVEPVGR